MRLPLVWQKGSKFTNEVQHLVKVLSWKKVMDISPLKRDVRFPDYSRMTDWGSGGGGEEKKGGGGETRGGSRETFLAGIVYDV